MIIFIIVCTSFSQPIFSQTIFDSTGKKIEGTEKKNTHLDSVIKNHSPRKAAIRSAILPGWGQAYNRKYWKIPIVYGAVGTTGYIFFHNITTYRDLRLAYKVKYNIRTKNDSTDFGKVSKRLLLYEEEALRFNRDEFRRRIDYSVLVFILAWGLNVIDATVDAHLKAFDVSPDLTLQFKAGYSTLAGTNGISLIIAPKK
ncbi:MAG TPA: DUF5683 domain-containing protein [Chitinophagaceae bacterium]|nr:DUF5683 domain-containing protein [Chitinophagaceae bacterium]